MADISVQEREHPPQEGFGAIFDNADGKGKSSEQMQEFVGELIKLADHYGFQLKTWGTRSAIRRFHRGLILRQLADSLDRLIEDDR